MNGNEEENGGAIKKVEQRLFNPNITKLDRVRSHLSPESFEVPSGWSDSKDINIMKNERKNNTPLLGTLLMASVIFFVAAVLIAAYFVFNGANVVSSDNVDLVLSGPVTARGGDEFDLQIAITNKNSVSLESVYLTTLYPEGSKIITADENAAPDSLREAKRLGTIKSNEMVTEYGKAMLFGEEGTEKDITVTMEYKITGSSALLKKEKTFKVLLNASPISIRIDAPKEVNDSKEFPINIIVTSNSTETIKGVLLRIDYPSSYFKHISSTPEPTIPPTRFVVWDIGDMAPGSIRQFKITGEMNNADTVPKVITATAGTKDNKDDTKIGTEYAKTTEGIVVKEPFIGLSLSINGNTSGDYIMDSRGKVGGTLGWSNNLPGRIVNGEIRVKINGEVLAEGTVRVDNGTFNSSENTIIWNKQTDADLGSIESGQTGTKNFSFSLLPLISGRQMIYENPGIDLEVSFYGTKFGGAAGADASVSGSLKRKIKISSDVTVGTGILYHSGPFTNRGPLPPRVDQETTYTVTLSAISSSNDISDATVRIGLPTYVKWLGVIYPATESVNYDQSGSEVVWKIGDLQAGTGITTAGKELSFQISLTPNLSQSNRAPIILNSVLISGTDKFTGVEVRGTKKDIQADLKGDPTSTQEERGSVK